MSEQQTYRGLPGTLEQRVARRFVTLACASSVFHNAGDRWPEAVDVSLPTYTRLLST
jgi:hypothetical protein